MAQTVLVADDDPLTRRVVQHYLESAGYNVTTASTGLEAMELATRELPQLIVLDMVLPDMDGPTVLRQLQNSDTTSSIPVIRISGNVGLLAHVEQSERNLVLAKPINADQFLTLVRRLTPKTLEDDKSSLGHSKEE